MGEGGKVNFNLFGYNGVNNTGSEAKLLTTIIDLKEMIGNRLGKIRIITQNVDWQRRYVPDPNIELAQFSPSTLINPFAALKLKADILFLSEGSTFIDHFSPVFLWMFCGAATLAHLRGEGVVAYSNDCGHLTPFDQKILKRALNNSVDLIMLRNPDAVARMKQYGVTHEIHLVADGAYLYPTPPKSYIENVWKKLNINPATRPVIGLCPKEFFWWPVKFKFIGKKEDLYNWPVYHCWTEEGRKNSRKYVEETARYADWCVEKFGVDVCLISMEHMDFPPTKGVYDLMKHKDHARMVSSDEFIVDDIVSVLSALKFQVTTRYHSTVLASPFGIPMISVSSDTRCEAVFRELDIMDYFIDYVKHPDHFPKNDNHYQQLVDMTEKLVANEDKLKNRILEGHKSFQERSKKIRPTFMNWFEKEYLPKAKL
jgi:polysaccharide pyruvyl transferase WcaK-like protein